MINIREELESHIRKLVRPLRDEDELKEILKVKLTKKEYKLLVKSATNEDLNMDLEKFEKAKAKLTKKLNQEKLKQKLMV